MVWSVTINVFLFLKLIYLLLFNYLYNNYYGICIYSKITRRKVLYW